MSNALVRTFSRSMKLSLQAKPLTEFAEEVLGDTIETAPAATEFPKMPKEIELTPEVRKALKALPALFGQVQPQHRRKLDENEIQAIGEEYANIQTLLKLIGQREEDIKEIVRTHQDVEAEEQGRAFPKQIRRGQVVIAEATPRDAKGHYLLAKPKDPVKTEVPGGPLAFVNQFTSGRLRTDLEQLTRDYEAGELDRETYMAVTVTRRVVDGEKLKKHVLKTGMVELMARVSQRGRASSSMNFRGLTKK